MITDFEQFYFDNDLDHVEFSNEELARKSWTSSREAIKAVGNVYRVRNLEWNSLEDAWCTSDYKYHVYIWSDQAGVRYAPYFEEELLGIPSLIPSDAKAACQAHFEAAIRKNLVEVNL